MHWYLCISIGETLTWQCTLVTDLQTVVYFVESKLLPANTDWPALVTDLLPESGFNSLTTVYLYCN